MAQQGGNNPAAPNVVFALAPGLLNHNVIDYSTKSGSEIYHKAIAELPIKFDLQGPNLRTFLKQIDVRAQTLGWEHILEIPVDIADPFGDVDLLTSEYGKISMEHLRNQVYTYINTNTRAAQDSFQLYVCLMNSLTEAALKVINLYTNDYTMNTIGSGPLLL